MPKNHMNDNQLVHKMLPLYYKQAIRHDVTPKPSVSTKNPKVVCPVVRWNDLRNCEFVTFPLVSWVRWGTWLYWFLIFAPSLILTHYVVFHKLDGPISDCIFWNSPGQAHIVCIYFSYINNTTSKNTCGRRLKHTTTLDSVSQARWGPKYCLA